MGLFSKLKDAIFSRSKHSDRNVKRAPAPSAPSTGSQPASPETGQTQPRPSPATAPEPKPMTAAELRSHLDQLETENPEKLEWRHSIVDLMKLVGMDSGYAERKELALDLGYSQEAIDSKGSAEMNIWLHKAVLDKLSEDLDGKLDMK